MTKSVRIRDAVVRTYVHVMAVCVACAAAVSFTLLSPHPSAILMLVCFIALTVINYRIGGRDVLYPAFIFCAAWALATVVYLFCPVKIDDLAWQTVLIFIGGAICFTAGCKIGDRPFATGRKWFEETATSYFGVRLLLFCCALILPFLVVDNIRTAGQSLLAPEFFIASREAIQNADAPSFSSRFLSLAQLIAVPTVWLLLLEGERKLLVVTGAFVATFACLLGGTRGPLLQMICGCLVLVLIRRRNRTLSAVGRRIAVSALAVVLLMTLLTLILKKETQGSDGLQVAADMSAVYISGGLAAFNYQVTHPSLFSQQPWNTITPVLSPLVKEGVFHIALPPVHEDFINIPFPFNVFTIYKPYYHDLGIAGCMVVLACIGFCYGYVFRAAIGGDKLAAFVLAAFTESLVMSIFHDPFNYRLTVCIFTIGYALFYFVLLRKLPRLTPGRLPSAQS